MEDNYKTEYYRTQEVRSYHNSGQHEEKANRVHAQAQLPQRHRAHSRLPR